MIQVQRFNKVLKLAVILGDLVILNVLFISLIQYGTSCLGRGPTVALYPKF